MVGLLTFKLLRFFPRKSKSVNYFKSLNPSDWDRPPKPVKALLKVEKNRDEKTGKAKFYFAHSRSTIMTNEEYKGEFGEVMKIEAEIERCLEMNGVLSEPIKNQAMN